LENNMRLPRTLNSTTQSPAHAGTAAPRFPTTAEPPFLPFSRPTIDEATIAAVGAVLRSGWITSGPKVHEFERELSAYFGGRPVLTFNSGTSTMEVALRVAGIGPGDEVITTPISWPATANVILAVGATPVFADIDPRTRNIDLDRLEAAITPRTRALLPVHLSGLPVDMERLYQIAECHRLRVIEDAAQAFGSQWRGRPIGAIGDLVSFSFQANKNLTTGEGGCLVLNDEAEAALAARHRLQGVTRSGFDGIDVDLPGGKHNMTDIMAAIGLGQFAGIDAVTAHRRALARHYFAGFGDRFEADSGARLPLADFEHSNWHLFQIILPDRGPGTRARFMEAMARRGIGTGFHYAAMHLFSLYRARGYANGMLPVAERIGRLTVSLPMFHAMTFDDVERVVAAVDSSLIQPQVLQ
jgi:dTDP-4-amino-4,6-dideoxygalactose transaminase